LNHVRRPLVVVLLAFLAGLLLALRFSIPLHPVAVAVVVLFAISGVCHAMGSRIGAMPGAFLLPLLFLGCGVLVGGLERGTLALDCRASLRDGEALELRGRLGTLARTPRAGRAPLLPLEQSQVFGGRRCSEVRVRLPSTAPELAAGAAIHARGTWRELPPPPGSSRWPRNPRLLGFLAIDSVVQLESRTPRRSRLGLRSRALADLAELFPRNAPTVEAVLLGRREYMDPAVRKRFSEAGLSHLLAISGMHVGLIAGSILLLANAMRLPRRHAIASTLLLVWMYLLVIGAPASALRAGLMISAGLTATLLQRPGAAAVIVAAAALAILGVRPLAILDPGFQLSFAGVLGILFLRSPLLRLTPEPLQHRGIVRSLTDAFLVGVAAFLATAPIVAHHFGIAAPISMIVGVPAVPLMSVGVVGAAAALALRPFVPVLPEIFAAGAAVSFDLLDRLAAFATRVPFGHGPVPRPPWWSWSIALAAAWLANAAATGSRRRLRRFITAGAGVAALVFWPLIRPGGIDGIEIHFIDVGQGDATAIRSPAGRWILVDAGPASGDFDAGERRVLPFLRSHGARRIEALVLTHPDLDHIGGAPAILRGIRVRYLFEPGHAVGKSSYLGVLAEVEQRQVEWRAVRSGRVLTLDGMRLEFLWPDAETVDVLPDANEISAVMRISYGSFALLLSGDAGADVERLLARRHGAALQSQILKLGHHGSTTSTTEEFLDVVRPELAVVSAGRRNRYGHPAPAVMARVHARGIPTARTDLEGTISVRVTEAGTEWSRWER
jgi:competence protein ComEC